MTDSELQAWLEAAIAKHHEPSVAYAVRMKEVVDELVIAATVTADLLDDETAYLLHVALASIRNFA